MGFAEVSHCPKNLLSNVFFHKFVSWKVLGEQKINSKQPECFFARALNLNVLGSTALRETLSLFLGFSRFLLNK